MGEACNSRIRHTIQAGNSRIEAGNSDGSEARTWSNQQAFMSVQEQLALQGDKYFDQSPQNRRPLAGADAGALLDGMPAGFSVACQATETPTWSPTCISRSPANIAQDEGEEVCSEEGGGAETEEWLELLCDRTLMRMAVNKAGSSVGIGVERAFTSEITNRGGQKPSAPPAWVAPLAADWLIPNQEIGRRPRQAAPLLFASVDVSRKGHTDVASLISSSASLSQSVHIVVQARSGERRYVALQGSRQASQKRAAIGMVLGTMVIEDVENVGEGQEGFRSYSCTYVKSVTRNSPAHRARVRAGDRVMAIMTARTAVPGLVLL